METKNSLPAQGNNKKTQHNNFKLSSNSYPDTNRIRHKNADHNAHNSKTSKSKNVLLTLGDYRKDLYGEAFIRIAGKLVPLGIINPDYSVIIEGTEYNTNKNTSIFLKQQ